MIQFEDVKQLLEQADANTLTVYLTTDNSAQENQASNPAWQTFIRQALRQFDAEHGKGKTGTWPSIRERVEAFAADYRPASKGLALIYGPEVEQVFELPVRLDNQAYYGKPSLTPLLWAIDEFEPYLVTMVDNEKAYFVIGYLGQAEFQNDETLYIDFGVEHFGEKVNRVAHQTGQYVTRGSVRDEFEDFVDEHIAQLHRKVAERTVELLDERGIRRLIVGGDERAAHAVRDILPEKERAKLVRIARLPLRLKPHEILAQVTEDALEFERQEEIRLVEQVIDFAKSGGRGALGWEAVRQALQMQQVELLILPWPVVDETQASDLAIKTFASGGTLELVHGEAAALLGGEGGLGARLYYAP